MIVKQIDSKADIDQDTQFSLWDNIIKIEKVEYPDREDEITKDTLRIICHRKDGHVFELATGMNLIFICNDEGKTIETIR